MRYLTSAALLLLPLAAASEDCAKITTTDVGALFDDWNFSLSSLDARQVSSRYWTDAVLLPTLSNTPRTSPGMIVDYFEHFLAKRPRGRIDTRHVSLGCNVAVDAGTYTFSLMNDKGAVSEVSARYTFVYQYHDGAWKILHHHSSAMPESAPATPANVPGSTHGLAQTAAPPAMQEVPAASSRERVSPPEPVAAAPAPAPAPKPVATAKPAPVVKLAKSAPKPAAAPSPPAPAPAAAPTAAPATAPAAPVSDKGSDRDFRTVMFANLASSPPPAQFYPAELRAKRVRGDVHLKVCSNESGVVQGTPDIMRTSGSKPIDEAALNWVKAAKWVPATLNHKRVEGCTELEIAFDPPT